MAPNETGGKAGGGKAKGGHEAKVLQTRSSKAGLQVSRVGPTLDPL